MPANPTNQIKIQPLTHLSGNGPTLSSPHGTPWTRRTTRRPPTHVPYRGRPSVTKAPPKTRAATTYPQSKILHTSGDPPLKSRQQQPHPKSAYQGFRNPSGTTVIFVHPAATSDLPISEHLPLRLDISNTSPNGFEWGYLGSGPHQLAIAILAHAADYEYAQDMAHAFKEDVIVHLPRNHWHLPLQSVLQWVDEHPLATASSTDHRLSFTNPASARR